MPWPSVALSDFCSFSGGGKLKLSKSDYVSDGYVAYSAAGPDGFVETREFIKQAVVVSAIGARCGKAFLALQPFTTLPNTYVVFPDVEIANTKFIWYQLNDEHSWIRSGTAQPFIKPSDIKARKVMLPPLAEQQRIVDILDRAAAIQRLRRAAEEKAREIIPALFLDMFGDPATNPKGWPVGALKEAADIGSGVTKGRKIDGKETLEVPYLRVANVQDGYLDLSEIKTIAILATEREKYALEVGDIVMTEGGDLDKLGRGYVWNGELPYCAHQNHVFRVRADRAQIDPLFLAAFIQSYAGKSYFLRVAKRTTGIASINKTQLGDMPLWLPPVELQREFGRRVSAIRAMAALHGNATKRAQEAAGALASSLLAAG